MAAAVLVGFAGRAVDSQLTYSVNDLGLGSAGIPDL